MKCTGCGTELPKGTVMCPQCGRAAEHNTCVACGAEMEKGALICPKCGWVVNQADVIKSRAAGGTLSKKEFYQLPGMKSCRNNIRGCAIILYFCCAMTVLASFLLTDTLSASVIDGVLLLALGLWLQFGKSRICAILTTCYGIFSMIVTMKATGNIQGWWIPLAGVWAISYTFKFHKLWNKYQKDGVLPDEAVKG